MQHSCTKILILLSALFTVLTAACANSFTACAADYTEQTITVDYNNQVVDSFYGVDAEYVLYYSDTGDYSCAGYVSKFYREIFGVLVYNINIIDDKPSVYCEGKDVELRTVTDPQPGDIMQNKDYTHVAIVKDCKDGEVTLIEQNYKWTWNDATYTVVNRKVIQDRHYYYRLYINGVEQSLDIDRTAPVISDMKSSDVTKDGFTVSAKLSDNKNVAKVKTAVYTEGTDKADIKWETFTNPSADFKYSVKTKDYSGRDDNYVVTFYAYDDEGNYSSKSVKTYVDTTPPTISGAKFSNISGKGFTLTFTVKDNTGVKTTQVPVWTALNSTDDKYVYTPEMNGSSGKITVSTKNHNNESGLYKSKIKVTDAYGNAASKTVTTTISLATAVNLNKNSVSLKIGTTEILKAELVGTKLTDSVSWKSSDSSAVSVSKGKITAKSVGKASVTAVTTGGKTAKCSVSVTDSISSAEFSKISSQTYTGSEITPKITVQYADKLLVQGEDYNVEYSDNKSVGKASVVIKGKGLFTGNKTITFNIVPPKVTGVKATLSGTTAKISWKAAKGANKYVVQRWNPSKKVWETLTKTTALSYSDKKLPSGGTYKYRVKAYKTVSGTNYCSSYCSSVSCVTAPAKVSCSAVSEKSGGLTVSWDAVDGATGYQIYVSDSGQTGTFKKLATVKKSTSYAAENLPSFSLKFVKVRAYRTSEGVTVFGKCSPVIMTIIK